jgi:hypothetical protein
MLSYRASIATPPSMPSDPTGRSVLLFRNGRNGRGRGELRQPAAEGIAAREDPLTVVAASLAALA